MSEPLTPEEREGLRAEARWGSQGGPRMGTSESLVLRLLDERDALANSLRCKHSAMVTMQAAKKRRNEEMAAENARLRAELADLPRLRELEAVLERAGALLLAEGPRYRLVVSTFPGGGFCAYVRGPEADENDEREGHALVEAIEQAVAARAARVEAEGGAA